MKYFGKIIFLLIFSCISLLTAREKGFVSVRGKEIVTPEGKPLLLRGVNLGNWLVPEGYMFKFKNASSPRLINQVISDLLGPEEALKFWKKFRDNYVTKKDIAYLKSIGLNSIRLPFDYRLFTPEGYPDLWTGPGFEMTDRIIKWCKEEGLWVILDMHCAPGGQTGDNIDNGWGYPFLFESQASQERFVKVWEKIASKYKNETTIIGYDLINEPIATYFNASKFNHLLEPLYIKATNAIRKIDKNHIIFPGGAQWNNNFSVFGKPFDSKLVYNFHKYWCDTTQTEIQQYVDFSNKYDVPLWMSESGENKDPWILGWRRLMERNNIGWCFWPYKKMDDKSCLITFNRPAQYDTVINYANASRNSFAEMRKSRPSLEVARKALEEFLENCKFENCRPNPGYHEALGVKTIPIEAAKK